MAAIDPVLTVTNKVPRVTWSGFSTADTGVGFPLERPAEGCVQCTGTFGSATIILQGSNDNSNWFPLKDHSGTAISMNAATLGFSFKTNAQYIRPSSTGGTADNVEVIVVMR